MAPTGTAAAASKGKTLSAVFNSSTLAFEYVVLLAAAVDIETRVYSYYFFLWWWVRGGKMEISIDVIIVIRYVSIAIPVTCDALRPTSFFFFSFSLLPSCWYHFSSSIHPVSTISHLNILHIHTKSPSKFIFISGIICCNWCRTIGILYSSPFVSLIL